MRARSCARLAVWVAALCLGALATAQAPDSGDALGAGLTPPTAARYADPAWYDLLDARWATDESGATVLELELAAIDPDAPLLQPIIEAYLIDAEAVGRAALPGTGLETPDDAGWAVAVRVAGAGAWAWTAAADAPLRARPLSIEVVGRTVRLAWPADLSVDGSWVAVSGVYDPFSDTGWRPFAAESSPWAFAGPTAAPPVVSVVPGGDEELLRLHATARLPRGEVRAPLASASPWWWWMGTGMALVFVGLAWRGRARPSRPPAAAVEATGTPALIGDDDVATDVIAVEPPQSVGAERSPETATAASDAAVDAGTDDDDVSGSERTTRAPSPASRSAKRS